MRDIHTTLMGNATADPSERLQSDGSVTAIVRMAVTGRYYDSAKSDFIDRKTEFITVFARRALARNLLKSISKGQPLVVTGRLGSSEWTAEDGAVRYSLTLQAEAIGHDLTFGTTTFTRPLKTSEIPDHDPRTGEMLDSTASGDVEVALTDDVAEDDALATAS
ncbi:single-stranded DNA-binding protein [Brachybacterium sp. FME24]|uniref:single-stranded DNA-binding protein n=1 Tax=Brachybacterium sp. FME24 TaxID=2742605 RepID=UPI0018681C4F|nr:single-stranded DNA-binding protein [Brachybacterium sp. FME24]